MLQHYGPQLVNLLASVMLLLAFAKRSEELKRGALALFFVIALVSLPTYMTGYSAQNAIKNRPGVSVEQIHHHQSAALLALVFMEATGVLAWFGLWEARRPAA